MNLSQPIDVLHTVLNACNSHLPLCHRNKALITFNALLDGHPYLLLGGAKLKRRPDLVRFKLGREFRLIFKLKDEGLVPYQLVTRQRFDRELKRRS